MKHIETLEQITRELQQEPDRKSQLTFLVLSVLLGSLKLYEISPSHLESLAMSCKLLAQQNIDDIQERQGR